MKPTHLILTALTLASSTSHVTAEAPSRTVEVANKPGGKWATKATRSLEDVPGAAAIPPDAALSRYGGLATKKEKATGFFRTAKVNGRWWLVDPEGCLFLQRGVNSVSMLRTQAATAAWKQEYKTETQWAEQTTALLRNHGFNGLGAWTDTQRMRAVKAPMAYTRIWNFMSSYGKKRGGTFQKPGHTGYPGDCIFVFDHEFETFCDEFAQQLATDKNDPWLLGHFSDNELPFQQNALQNFLALPEDDAGHQAAWKWFRAKRGNKAEGRDITPEDSSSFLEFMVGHYFRIVSQAIKKRDPNHLYLGTRFHGSALRIPEIFRAAGPHLDVVSVNYYHGWTPDPERLSMWSRESGKPSLITEWYAKAIDSGMANTSGAGWLVKTQRDRGLFYENFTLGLLESKDCVGWHWFKYIDNDPSDPRADPSNSDSNKGIFSNRYQPHTPLLDSMKRINERAYGIVNHLDNRQSNKR